MADYKVFKQYLNNPNASSKDKNAFLVGQSSYRYLGDGFENMDDMMYHLFKVLELPEPIRIDPPNFTLKKRSSILTDYDWLMILSDEANRWTFITFWDNDRFEKEEHPIWVAYQKFLENKG